MAEPLVEPDPRAPSAPLTWLRDETFGPFFFGNLVSNAGNWFQNLAAAVSDK